MDVGMLWFDNDPKSDLNTKINRAAAYYRLKYGQSPNLCFVHPNLLDDSREESGPIQICSNSSIILNHFWLGIQTRNLIKT